VLFFHFTSFALGIFCALSIGIFLKIAYGMKLNLYLIDDDSESGEEPSIIPLTTELRKTSFWDSLTKKTWREDVLITLVDYQGQSFQCGIQNHIWAGFSLLIQGQPGKVLINRREVLPGKKHYLKTGMSFQVGDRKFKILISQVPPARILMGTPD
jgi:hypothetical protein